jgi:type IV pilus assembly protein PilN
MRVTLNLATKPWVDTATIVQRLRIALGVLAGVCLLCLLGLHFESSAALHAQQKRDAMDAQQAKLNNEKRMYESELQQPRNQAILERSQFLNSVFAQKSFSWTAVMMDLENVLPAGVQVASLDPQVLPAGGIVVRLRVRGDRDRGVDLLRNLERSKRFLTPRLAAEATESQGGAQNQAAGFDANAPVAFEILADYNPVTPEAKHETEARPKKETKSDKAATPAKKPVTSAAAKASGKHSKKLPQGGH